MQAFALTFVGLLIGRRLGKRFGERAELAAGVVLALLGVTLFVSEITGAHFV
ncbi:MAG: manganese efflux pump MntP family protein [Thermomicrobia bacterium]|nr:manganese efflux pump MntP family protein [Thermomicrobia bacterium]MCA1724275.1 manganese efflux pump MntP family protein [Thermomicrobia bacterium]